MFSKKKKVICSQIKIQNNLEGSQLTGWISVIIILDAGLNIEVMVSKGTLSKTHLL